MLIVRTKSEKETLDLGFKIGKNIFYPAIIALIGELGSGKTVFARGIAKGMGIKTRIKSPSFVIINEYAAAHPLYHFDFYRLEEPGELSGLGYEEYFSSPDGVVVIEWADKIIDFLPPEYLEVRIKMEDFNLRKIILIPRGNKRYHDLVLNVKSEIKC